MATHARCGAELTYRSSLEFLNETDNSVKQQKTANDTEIDPVLKTGSQDGSGLHDELNRSDEEHELQPG